MRFLVVDDSTTMRRIITNVVLQLGVLRDDIQEAEDGLKAYNLFQKNEYDIILTDWNMPNMNGLSLVQHIRKIDPKIPIIMITTEGGKEEVITALKAGVNNYIVKPFDANKLKEKINSLKIKKQ